MEKVGCVPNAVYVETVTNQEKSPKNKKQITEAHLSFWYRSAIDILEVQRGVSEESRTVYTFIEIGVDLSPSQSKFKTQTHKKYPFV